MGNDGFMSLLDVFLNVLLPHVEVFPWKYSNTYTHTSLKSKLFRDLLF